MKLCVHPHFRPPSNLRFHIHIQHPIHFFPCSLIISETYYLRFGKLSMVLKRFSTDEISNQQWLTWIMVIMSVATTIFSILFLRATQEIFLPTKEVACLQVGTGVQLYVNAEQGPKSTHELLIYAITRPLRLLVIYLTYPVLAFYTSLSAPLALFST